LNPHLDESVHLSEPSDDWPLIFAAERGRLLSELSVSVEHIGSTAVPGLVAKAIVDMQLGAEVYPPSAQFVGALERMGYTSFGEAGVPGRLYFCLRGERNFNVHVVLAGGNQWLNNLALRNYLRRSATARDEYARAKLAAIASGATTLVPYSSAKAAVLASLLARAQAVQNGGSQETLSKQ
jgi:GrpB-like predicted nucleotidyltransferase (UPF0157 family)